jgi:hypothetical protein
MSLKAQQERRMGRWDAAREEIVQAGERTEKQI